MMELKWCRKRGFDRGMGDRGEWGVDLAKVFDSAIEEIFLFDPSCPSCCTLRPSW